MRLHDARLRTDSLSKSIFFMNTEIWSEADMQTTRLGEPHYICHYEFAGITMAMSFVLLLTANVSLVLGIVTRAPDTLGFVSMAARDNRYFRRYVPSHLEGSEAARALRDVKVIIGDVNGEAEVGHIALATMDAKPRRLSWTRMYD